MWRRIIGVMSGAIRRMTPVGSAAATRLTLLPDGDGSMSNVIVPAHRRRAVHDMARRAELGQPLLDVAEPLVPSCETLLEAHRAVPSP